MMDVESIPVTIHDSKYLPNEPPEFFWFLPQVVGLIYLGGVAIYTWYMPGIYPSVWGWAYTGHIYRGLPVTTFCWFPQAPSRTQEQEHIFIRTAKPGRNINGLTPWCRRPPFGGPWLSDVMRCYPTCFHICHVCPWFSPVKAHSGVLCPDGPCFTQVLTPSKWSKATWPGAGKGLPLQGKVFAVTWEGSGKAVKAHRRGFVSWWAVLRARFETL